MSDPSVPPYEQSLHAIQTGVKIYLQRSYPALDEKLIEALKHFRTGLDARACDHCALVTLLINKGVIARDEYLQQIKLELHAEVKRYEDSLREMFGLDITLG